MIAPVSSAVFPLAYSLAILIAGIVLAASAVVLGALALRARAAATRRLHAELDAHRRDEARWRLIVEQMPSVLWATDRELRFTSSEGGGLAKLDSTPNAVCGLTLYEYFRTEDRGQTAIAAHLRALDGQSTNYEFEWKGQTYASHVEPLRDAGGEIIGVVGSALDVTERKAADVARAKSEAKYRTLLTAIPDIMFRVGRDGTLLEFIDNIAAPGEHRVGRHLRESFPPEAVEALLAMTQRALALREVVLFEHRGGCTPEQADTWFDVRVVPGGADDALVIARNISEQKASGDALRRREAQLRALLSAIPDVIVELTPDGRIAGYTNPREEQGLPSPLTVLGRKVSDLVPPETAWRALEHLHRVVETGQKQVFRFTLHDPRRDAERSFEARLVPKGDGEEQVLALVRDVTELREPRASRDATV